MTFKNKNLMFNLKLILLAIVVFIAHLNFQIMPVEASSLSQSLTAENTGTPQQFPVTLISQSAYSSTKAEKIAFRRQAIRNMKE
ncbi:hypothetical protein cce_2917 [Crocosphaera subtropica ATCC 51142]|uniref:Uncharacterized protein n=2 Tax=Crocosphaera TaxID=263510 RepID=B1WV68_CROS5|nr:hypothetical protein cce_2917 [Crocosphaera subtropica ATCC 51142]